VAWRNNRNGGFLPSVVLPSSVTALSATFIAPKQPQAHQMATAPSGTAAIGMSSHAGAKTFP
jgi:hypothetical protein